MFSSRLCVILVLAVNLVHALPIPQTSGLERRTDPHKSNNPTHWPTEETLNESLKTKPNQAEFWAGHTPGSTGSPVSAQHSASAHAMGTGGKTLEMALHDAGHTMPGWNPNDKATTDKWSQASQAFAKGASGHVNAHVGENVRPDSIYKTQEKPILENNPNVKSITEHEHGKEGVAPKVVHTKEEKTKK
jgi:hypothetical protein